MNIINKHLNKTIYYKVLDSSNDYLLNNYDNLDDSTLVICDKQTKGRGRKGHNWVSNGNNIYMSLLLKPTNIDNPSLLTQVVGLSLNKTINKLYSVNSLIKWPNDIFLNNKKIAGILVESKYTSKLECIVIGIGINVNQLDFSNNELTNASSLYLETNKNIEKDVIINEFINTFYNLFDLYNSDGFNYFVKEINNNLYNLNKEVYVTNNVSIHGLCKGINNNGELIITNNNEDIILNSNEVSIMSK